MHYEINTNQITCRQLAIFSWKTSTSDSSKSRKEIENPVLDGKKKAKKELFQTQSNNFILYFIPCKKKKRATETESSQPFFNTSIINVNINIVVHRRNVFCTTTNQKRKTVYFKVLVLAYNFTRSPALSLSLCAIFTSSSTLISKLIVTTRTKISVKSFFFYFFFLPKSKKKNPGSVERG